MTYIEFVCNHLKSKSVGIPIYIRTVAEKIADEYKMDEQKAAFAASVAFKRILDTKLVPELRFYQKGIYYKTAITPFGETKINREQLIADKYILPNIGYETGMSLMYQIGLTTQIPNERCVATNAARDCTREDKKLGVIVKPPKVKITAQNKDYLQTLDAIDLIGKTPIDEKEPYILLANHIRKKGLEYKQLLIFANNYYNKNTILRLANIASVGGTGI